MAVSVATTGSPETVTVTTIPSSQNALTPTATPVSSVGWINEAVWTLRAAEEVETCPYCRSHIVSMRVLCEDLLAVAEMGDDLRKHEALRRLAVRMGEVGESVGALSFVARVIHRVKGLR